MDAEIQAWLSQGIAAAKANDAAQARQWLLRVIEKDEHNEFAWLWLASVVDSEQERRICLENVLTVNPDNENARAWLAMLSAPREPAQASEVVLPKPGPPPAAEPSLPEGIAGLAYEDIPACPYCGQETGLDLATCPHCQGRLLIDQPIDSPFASRLWLLVTSWIVLVLTYVVVDASTLSAVRALLPSEPGQKVILFTDYITGLIATYVVNFDMLPKLPAPTLVVFLNILAATELIAIAWSVVVVASLPSRRLNASTLAAGVLIYAGVLNIFQIMSGFYLGLIKLVVTAAVGLFLYTSLGEFMWKAVRYDLSLDRGLKTPLDYYNRGRRYRELGMLAKAILHWEQAARLKPDQASFRIPLSNALYKAGRYQEAGQHVRAALDVLPPGSPQAHDLRQFLDAIQARLQPDEQAAASDL